MIWQTVDAQELGHILRAAPAAVAAAPTTVAVAPVAVALVTTTNNVSISGNSSVSGLNVGYMQQLTEKTMESKGDAKAGHVLVCRRF